MVEKRKCSRCHEEFPLTADYFPVHEDSHKGFYYYCKKCLREYNRNYQRARRAKKKAEQQFDVDSL